MDLDGTRYRYTEIFFKTIDELIKKKKKSTALQY